MNQRGFFHESVDGKTGTRARIEIVQRFEARYIRAGFGKLRQQFFGNCGGVELNSRACFAARERRDIRSGEAVVEA